MPTSGVRDLNLATPAELPPAQGNGLDDSSGTTGLAVNGKSPATPEHRASVEDGGPLGRSGWRRLRTWTAAHPVPTLILAFGAAVRVLLAVGFDGPMYTRDVVRGVLTGQAVWTHGIRAAGRPLLDTYPWATESTGVPWSHLPYNYPPVPVGFFTLVAALGGGTVLAKLLLTASDAACAGIITKLTGRRSFGLAYWISPISVWWTSHEGQFETLQSLLGLGALATMERPIVSGALIALAIQTKLTGAALVPFLVWTMWKRRRLRSFALGVAIGSVPTAAVSFLYPIVPNVFRYSAQFRWNPYYWNPVDPTHQWSKHILTMRILPQVLSVLFFVWVLVLFRSSTLRARASAAFAFALFMKFYSQIPSWYLITVPLMLVPLVLRTPLLPDRRAADSVPDSTSTGEGPRLTRTTRLTRSSMVTVLTFLWLLAFSADAVTLKQLTGTM
jgi:hypothetical protein